MNFFTSTSNDGMSARKTVFGFMSLSAMSLGLLAAFNYMADPEAVYRSDEESADVYVEELLGSSHGMVSDPRERVIKRKLGVASNTECYVIGSSRSMQLSIRDDSWISDECASLTNLGVSGAGLEDVISYLWLLQDKERVNVFLAIDPWMLDFGVNARWKENSDLYIQALRFFGYTEEADRIHALDLSKIVNLFNKGYLISSFRHVYENGVNVIWRPHVNEPQAATSHIMDDDNVILPDGSLSYSVANRERLRERDITRLNEDTMSAKVNDDAVDLLESAVMYLKEKGNDVVFVLPPMHPHAFKYLEKIEIDNIQRLSDYVVRLSDRTQSPFYGSWFGGLTGCSPDDFYDAIHPAFSCIELLRPSGD